MHKLRPTKPTSLDLSWDLRILQYDLRMLQRESDHLRKKSLQRKLSAWENDRVKIINREIEYLQTAAAEFEIENSEAA